MRGDAELLLAKRLLDLTLAAFAFSVSDGQGVQLVVRIYQCLISAALRARVCIIGGSGACTDRRDFQVHCPHLGASPGKANLGFGVS